MESSRAEMRVCVCVCVRVCACVKARKNEGQEVNVMDLFMLKVR